MTTAPARRGGFTLIELIVVIALLAVLAAISAGVFFRVRGSQVQGATERTLDKLNTLINPRWTAVIDSATNARTSPPPDTVVQMAGGDPERARALWAHAKLVNEFPETYHEAVATLNLNPPGSADLTAALAPRAVYVQAMAPLTKLSQSNPVKFNQYIAQYPNEIAAALLHVAISKTGNRGQAADSDGLTQQTGEVTIGTAPDLIPLTVYKDGWGSPITFVRWRAPAAEAAELDAAPYARPTPVPYQMANGNQGLLQVINPLDPQGRLTRAVPANQGTPTGWPLRTVAITRLNVLGTRTAVMIDAADSHAHNIVPTVVSAGPNKNLDPATGQAFAPAHPDGLFGGDNLVSFRLRREGNRGD